MAEARTWHVDSPSQTVPFSTALEAWVEAAEPVLQQIASRPNGFLTYSDLAERLQDATGFHTRTVTSEWIPRVLDALVERTVREPALGPLASLVVQNETGEVGPGYHNTTRRPRTMGAEQLMVAAAEDRLACYRRYNESLPQTAGPRPTPLFKLAAFTASVELTPAATKAAGKKSTSGGRSSTTRRSPGTSAKAGAAPKKRSSEPEEPPAICMSCFMQLPTSGVCDNCS